MKYVPPGLPGSIVSVEPRYENFIGGKWLAPTHGRYRLDYHQYPAGASFSGYKISGVGRENHFMMLDHYSRTKNLLVSYSTKPLGLF